MPKTTKRQKDVAIYSDAFYVLSFMGIKKTKTSFNNSNFLFNHVSINFLIKGENSHEENFKDNRKTEQSKHQGNFLKISRS